MSEPALHITRLSIHRMPGFNNGLPPFEDLSKGIQLIAGPNASGKSSTARIIQQLFSKEHMQGIHVEAHLEVDGEEWWVKNEEGRVQMQRGGTEDQLKGLPSRESSERYMLAFHDLIRENEAELANTIAKEAIGGYDLDAAEEKLGYEERLKTSNVGEYREYEKARKARETLQKQQLELKKKEEQLKELRTRKDEAEKAAQRVELYEKARGFREAEQEVHSREEQFNKFPPILEKVRKGDSEKLEELETDIGRAEDAIREAERKQEEAGQGLKKLGLPEEGIPSEILNELDERVENLKELRQEVKGQLERIQKQRKKEEETLAHLGEGIDPAQWEGLSLGKLGDLDEFLQEAHGTMSEKRILEAEKSKLEEELSDKSPSHSSEVLQRGIWQLSEWLKEGEEGSGRSSSRPQMLALLAMATGLFAFLLGWQFPSLGWTVPLILIGIIAWMAFFKKKEERLKKGSLRRSDYEKSELPDPETWSPEAVGKKLEGLLSELHVAKEAEEKKKRVQELERELQELETRITKVQEKHEAWKKELEAVPDLPQENLRSYSQLATFLDRMKKWQDEHSELEGAKAEKEAKEEQIRQELEKANARFKEYRYSEAKDEKEAEGILRTMKEHEQQRSEWRKEFQRLEEEIGKQQKEKERNEGKLKELRDRLELNPDQKEQVRSYEEQLDSYEKAKNELEVSRQRKEDLGTALKAHSLFPEHEEELKELRPDELGQKKEEEERAAAEKEGIRDEISSIQAKVDRATEGRDMEQALAEEEKALDGLEELYEENLSSIAGKVLVDGLRKGSEEQDRPRVLQKADELLTRITHGAYQLRLGTGEEGFRAFDTRQGIGQGLEELSTGTRVQLLFAVRLAFIEVMEESSYKLPLLADELLGNSDDQRAQAVIEALAELSREGRQIFYFTAQGDEVAKWRAFAQKNPELKIQERILQSGSNEEASFRIPDSEGIQLYEEIPSPEGHDHASYRKLLQVAPFDPMTENAEQLHISYLIEDPNALAECLRLRIRSWKQLELYIENGGNLKHLDKEKLEQYRKRIEVLERYLELYRRGRPVPIDRSLLEASDAVSDAFIDKVDEKLKELNGDPEALIEALRNGEVKGFRNNKVDELEEELRQHRKLPEEERMEEEAIVAELQGFISERGLSVEEMEGLLGRVLGG